METENAIKLSDTTIQSIFRCIATKKINIYSVEFWVERNIEKYTLIKTLIVMNFFLYFTYVLYYGDIPK